MIYLEEALEKFKNLAPEVVLTVDSDWVAEKITVLENKYQTSLSDLVIYWAIGEVKVDQIKDYLKRELGLDGKLAEGLEQEIIEKIIKSINERLIFLDASPAKSNISMSQEKLIILEILKSKLKEELNSHPVIINAINSRIFTILSQDHDFFVVMEKALYTNKEKITSSLINVSGKSAEPTVTSWLSDFIATNGTDYFTTVTLSQYITNSVNTKNLSNKEKGMVTGLLLLYRNLKFFSQTFDEISSDKWEILPLRLDEKNNNVKTPTINNDSVNEMTTLELRALKEIQNNNNY